MMQMYGIQDPDRRDMVLTRQSQQAGLAGHVTTRLGKRGGRRTAREPTDGCVVVRLDRNKPFQFQPMANAVLWSSCSRPMSTSCGADRLSHIVFEVEL